MKKILIVLILIIFSVKAYNQIIKGTVLDRDTKQPIDFAVAYFAGTFTGTQSDVNGKFSLDISKYPSMPLTISALGYYSLTVKDIFPEKTLLVYMTPKVFNIKEVVVTGKSHAREANLRLFRKQFLGETPNAGNCKIINEDDISLIMENDTLKAFASKPILIDNEALGYRITFFLDKFEFDAKNTLMYLKGNVLFNEDLGGKESRKNRFDRRRALTYLGSTMQFFRALWDGRLKEEGYSVSDSDLSGRVIDQITGKNIAYLKNKRAVWVRHWVHNSGSRLEILNDTVYFDRNGTAVEGIRWFGEIASQRMADILPDKYSPEQLLVKDEIERSKDPIVGKAAQKLPSVFDRYQKSGSNGFYLKGTASVPAEKIEKIEYKAPGTQKLSKEDAKKAMETRDKIRIAYEGYNLRNAAQKQDKRAGPLTDFLQPFPLNKESEFTLKGIITDASTGKPVSYAEIRDNESSVFTLSNEKGEFRITDHKNPILLTIRKLGYKEASILKDTSKEPVIIQLVPIEISGERDYRIRLQYAELLKKAADKLKTEPVSPEPNVPKRSLVYCRTTTSGDSVMKSLFEGYAHMDASKSYLQGFQPEVLRFTPSSERLTGLSGNRLSYSLEGYLRLPPLRYLERFVKNKGSFEQDGNQIAIASLKSGESETTYFIRLADTVIVHIERTLASERKSKIKGKEPSWMGNRKNFTEISLSPARENRKISRIDFVAENELVDLIKKDQPSRRFSKSSIIKVMPDTSKINDALKDYLLKESMTRSKQQINFNSDYSLSNKGNLFDSEMQKLFLRPYSRSFWSEQSAITPSAGEKEEIQKWEDEGRFYSDNILTPASELSNIDSLVKKMNKSIMPVENVYLESDRQEYLAGDTIWFGAWVLDNLRMDSLTLSRVLYVDLINPGNKLEKQLKLYIRNGRARGEFALNKEQKNGIFRIRAYTQWMRNFQGDYFFEKEIPVFQSNINNLIAVNPVITRTANGDSLTLFVNAILPPGYKNIEKQLDLNIRLNDSITISKRFPFKENFHEALSFYVPDSYASSSADVKITLSDIAYISEQRLSIPLKANIDLQFFPESGKLVDGINSIVAFKAEDHKGNPTELQADIVDNEQNIIAHIKGDKTGTGTFSFTPELKKSYNAIVTSGTNKYLFKLPQTEPKGYVISYNPANDYFTIKNNQNFSTTRHYLLASVRGAVYNALELKTDTVTVSVKLPFQNYPKGIVQVVLTDSLYRPLAERLVFNNNIDQKLKISVESDKITYGQKEMVNLTVQVTDADDNPVESSLSMAVLDGSKCDSLKNYADIESYLYLASELKGKIDYNLLNLSDTTSAGKQKIDLVMMTQGWRNYLWNSIRYTNTIKEQYPYENGFFVTGNIGKWNSKRKPDDYMLNFYDSGNGYFHVVDINERGRFRVDFPMFYNTHSLFIQNRNEKDKIEDINFTLDTIPAPAIAYRKGELPYNAYKPGALKAIDEKIAGNDSIERGAFRRLTLPEVTVTAKMPRRDLTPNKEVDLNKTDPTGKKYGSLMQMIMGEFGEKARAGPLVIILYGASYESSDGGLWNWILSRPVNEISNVKFYEAGSDMSLKFGGKPVVSLTAYADFYRGNPKGAVVLPFQGFYDAKEFYQPKYEVNTSNKTDNRATIYWNPEVKTDMTGRAKVSFYNSDLEGDAVVKVSGVSFQLKDAAAAISHYQSK